MRVATNSLGCNKNLVDTEIMLAHLVKAGCVLVDEPEEADCLLVNTCSFLTEAVEESLDRIVELGRMKEEGGPGRLVVTGCLVSRYGDEILKEIVIPLKENVIAVYKKLGRRKAETLSVVSVCIAVVKENGICKEAKIALGAVAPRPVLASKAAMLLKGKALDDALIEQVSEQIESEISPIDDQRSTRYFRTRASKTTVKNLLKEIGE